MYFRYLSNARRDHRYEGSGKEAVQNGKYEKGRQCVCKRPGDKNQKACDEGCRGKEIESTEAVGKDGRSNTTANPTRVHDCKHDESHI